MRTTLQINLSDFLDPRGCTLATTDAERQLVEFLTRVVVTTTHDLDEPLGAIPCRRQTGRRPCKGLLVASFSEHDDIYWFCPLCCDNGTISHWQGTFWDMTLRTPNQIIF